MSVQEDNLLTAVQDACQPTYVPKIVQGREAVLALPRDWVIANIERVASNGLDLANYWEYRRLLELYSLLIGWMM